MAAIFRGDGSQITVVTPADGVIEGQIVAIGNLIGIASETRDEGTTLNLFRTGTFTVPKIAADAYAAGDAVYFDAESGKASAQTGELPLLGYVVADAPADNTEVLIVLAYAQPAAETPIGYTELTFTWWQSGTSAPVILQTLVNTTGLAFPNFVRFGAGTMRFAFSAALSPSAGKVTIQTEGINEDGTAPRIFGSNCGANSSSPIIYVFDAAGTKVDNVGNGTTLYASTTIRIYP